ncbi:UDP-N-acetylmuramoyl-L-alanyl-D-glutamate--2,6-diaminopimelate ligase [Marivirga sp. S37H4]|uniref:UDP-N-acetylmuramoyl-L-alanyl-D-glutamate--2,6-diaminopimelate ligase n=1 Tax=Marivirga aurantiaca TaxID=2802615 RepID=A0A935CAV0_9BACT|nr:UDP-N-acetylmuramoyl-L-alanyl-D-glutamate--2,6-diaminopimelate ligase [Marivirga aurantiaca]MBK6266966.1 UDP-N-acetylmuramoyl-L-alanyl-D-glutamate--2,6-diaminopimelate ligase [Marivirga aurantiaca]
MALLKDILYKVKLLSVSGNMELDVNSIHFDSRKVLNNDVFVAINGTQVDGHEYIEAAIEKGAKAIVCENLPKKLNPEITYIQTDNSARALGLMADNFYDHPSSKLSLVAITGTNGKTTTVTLLHQLFRRLGYNVGLLSTVQNQINESVIPATHTTPDAMQLNELLQKMVKAGCSYVFMEASSHAIDQERMSGLKLAGAVFSNISHDHLDYHKSFESYIKAKKKLFDELPATAFALVNVDDKRGMVMLQNCKATKYTYSLKMMANYRAKVLSNAIQGLELNIDQKDVWFRLIGYFNAYNLLATYAVATILEEDSIEVLTHLSQIELKNGRFEQIPNNAGITAIVDYAHTPDALENVLHTIDNIRTGNEQVLTVIGCGGNRDKDKRPLMAEIACRLSDRVILTSDNPRNEEPGQIIADMQKGVPISQVRKVTNLPDRKEAIKLACSFAQKGDIILVAGKGHETYQEIKGVKHHFDDKETVNEMLNLIHNR